MCNILSKPFRVPEKHNPFGAGEMTQWLPALAVLPGEPDSITSNHMVGQNTSFQENHALFWSLWSQSICDIDIYM